MEQEYHTVTKMKPGVIVEKETVVFENAAASERWLESNHGRTTGVWILLAKKGAGLRTIRYPEAVDCALCFGWIDGRKEKKRP